MDWHVTNIAPKYGSGWTGYTWNREYFPEPERFLKYLHQEGMHVTLNVHPAEGVTLMIMRVMLAKPGAIKYPASVSWIYLPAIAVYVICDNTVSVDKFHRQYQ